MSFNRKELATRLALTAAIMVAGAFAPKPALSQIRTSGTLGQSTASATLPEIKSDPPPKKPSLDIVPLVVSNLRSGSFFKRFRSRVSEYTDVSITDFGPHRYAGTVVPEEGVRLRYLPTVNSEPASDVKWLDWGEQIGFQFMVTFRGKDQQLLERWILIDEKERPGARWKCPKGWHRGQGRCFATMQIGDEVLIDFSNITPPPADEVKFYPWPSPK